MFNDIEGLKGVQAKQSHTKGSLKELKGFQLRCVQREFAFSTIENARCINDLYVLAQG